MSPPVVSDGSIHAVEDVVHSKVDILIIGAGPAGVMMANWLSRFSSLGISIRIIDRRPTELIRGQADGLMARTMEIFEHLNVLADVQKECSPISELRFWSPDPETGKLRRTSAMPQDVPGDSRHVPSVLHQHRVEHCLNENSFKNSNGQVVVERGVLPESLDIDPSALNDFTSHPIIVRLRHLIKRADVKDDYLEEAASGLHRSTLFTAEEQDAFHNAGLEVGRSEVVSAKYVIGCDGAHSWVRRRLGIAMIGEQTNYVWGVVEGTPITNFPDIRTRAAVHSAKGSLMVIPQERDMVRLYIQLPIHVEQGAYLDRSGITPESILNTARAVLAPYTINMKNIVWYTGYPIGQRLTESYSKANRVFLAGDACHTHSPKAGQGMNISMHDTYNLGWKMGLVLAGLARPELLHTYADERRMVANDLIEFDYKFSRLWSGKPVTPDGAAASSTPPNEFERVFEHSRSFTAGILINYPQSAIVRKDLSRPELSKYLPVGKRFFSVQVVNIASASAEELVANMPADGAFRILVFAGRVAEPKAMKRLRRLAQYLDSPESVVSRYTPADRHRDSVIDVLTIHSSQHLDVELYDFPQPSIFLPHNYNKVFSDEPSYYKGDGKAYETFGIDKDEGAVVVVRPDNYIGLVVGLDDTERLEAYFTDILIPANDPHSGNKVEVVSPPE